MTSRAAAILIACNLCAISLSAKPFTLQAAAMGLVDTTSPAPTGPHIDPSKPTNFYNRLSSNAEYNFLSSGKRTFGYRANYVWASASQKHSVQLEVPVLYSTASKHTGLGDFRFRYYWIPYRDYSKRPGALRLVIDAYLPTGSYTEGLGRGRWIFATGAATAFVFGKFSIFPALEYLYSTRVYEAKTIRPGISDLHGYVIQSTLVFDFSRKSYIDLTPIFMKNSYSHDGRNDFVTEGNYLYMVKKNKLQVGGFARRYWRGRSSTVRLSVRTYF